MIMFLKLFKASRITFLCLLQGNTLTDVGDVNETPDNDNHFIQEQKLQIQIENKGIKSKIQTSYDIKPYVNSNKLNNVVGLSVSGGIKPGELDFVPDCSITAREAVSAIHRARTQDCKKLIANVTCLAQKKLLYPTNLRSYCPAPGNPFMFLL